MKIEELKKVQQVQLQIMDNIHTVCVKHDITYYIIGGTALGALRHGGFIPWDIDIDIAMPREDYDRFLKCANESLDDKFICHNMYMDSNYFPPHALVALEGSELIQKDDYLNPNLKRYGIFVDIFPLDVAPNDDKLRKRQAHELIKIKNVKKRKMGITYSENSAIIKLIKKVITFFYCLTSWNKLNERQEHIMKRYSAETDNLCWCSMASHYSYNKQCMPKEIYGTPTLVSFSGHNYFAPERIEEYLKRIYGDYMRLPSVEAQQEQLNYFISASWNDKNDN